MSTQVQRRKGTTVQHSTFTGASAELTVDTTKNTVIVHDGSTAGGIPLAKETGSAISATSLSLPNSTTNGVAFVNSSKVVVAGSTFTFDGTNLSVNGITVGKGAGSSSFNTAVGELALGANTSSATNTAIGYNAMKAITTGSGNTAVGAVALTLASDTGNNTAIGRGALFPSTGTQNTALGYNAGGSMSSGSKNVIIGSFSGNDINYGTGFDIRTLNNYIVLSDGDANVRAYWNGANPTFPGALTLSDGTANGVAYLNGFKVLTSGTALTFDGSKLEIATTEQSIKITGSGASNFITIANTSRSFNFGVDATGFNIYDNTAATYRLNLNSTGLGIGTSSPAAKLHVDNGSGCRLYVGLSNNIYEQAYDHIWQTLSGASTKMTLDSSGNLGLGVVPSATTSGVRAFELQGVGSGLVSFGSVDTAVTSGTFYSATGWKYSVSSSAVSYYYQQAGAHKWFRSTSAQVAGTDPVFSQAMTLDASGNLLVGTTTTSSFFDGKLNVAGRFHVKEDNSTNPVAFFWNTNTTVDNGFLGFYTEASATLRGSVSYNRAGGLTAYNTTSDYRAKDISGPVADSGALIDSVPVYMGKMKGATQERPMFIAHETPPYAHTGEKDAVDKDGNPVFQQMDASALVPVLWAELQSLRARVASLESK